MSETKTPQAGEWWVNNHRHEIVRVVGWTATGDIVMEYANGEVLTSSWWYMNLWHHEPRCTGFDWQELSPVDPGEGYELLTDPIRELGDEWFDGRRWRKSNPALAGSRPSEVAYRRKIETAEVKPPEPEFCTACGVHSVVPGTKTCCGCTGYVSLEGMKAGTVKITPVDPPGATIAMMQPMEPTEFFNKYHPAESPDDWVEITDPDHMPRDGVDWFNGGCNDTWVIHEPHHCRTTLKEYQRSWSRGKFRCRRKDLPDQVPVVKRVPVGLIATQYGNVIYREHGSQLHATDRFIFHDADGFFVKVPE